MRLSRITLAGLLVLLFLAALVLAVSPAQAAVSNSSRIDVGPSRDVRLNEPFFVTADVYDVIQITGTWWDTDNATDGADPHDGIYNNDRDVFTRNFEHAGVPRLGDIAFTLWINYSDGVLANGTLVIHVSENQAPVITVGAAPTGFVGEAISFTVVVTDADSPESTLSYSWDFDVDIDTNGNGVRDDDGDSRAKTGVNHTYLTEGTYTAKFSVEDDFNATTSEFITVTVRRPEGVSGLVVEAGKVVQDNKTIRKGGWIAYHIRVEAGRLYQYDVDVTNGVPVYVFVVDSQQQFDQFKSGTITTAYQDEYSTTNPGTDISKQFRPEHSGDYWVIVDTGFLFSLPTDHQAETNVVVQDVQRDDFFGNIPFIVWITLLAVVGAVGAIFGMRAYADSAEVRRQERERKATEDREKASARGELAQFLQNPDEVVKRKYQAPPPQAPAPVPQPRPSPQAQGAPRPSGPQAPAGYVPPAPRPAPAPSAGPRPGPQATAPAPAAVGACPKCATPIETGWQICPSCGSAL